MSRLSNLVTYICATYPRPDQLSNARLTKMVYLADWQSARTGHGQLTDIKWVFHNYGPWVPDVMQTVAEDNRLQAAPTVNAMGSDKRLIQLAAGSNVKADELLDDYSRAVVDAVIADTQSLYFGEFIEHVYDTRPVRESMRHTVLDLVAIAADGDQEDAPIDLRKAMLSPTEYAKIRDILEVAVANALLSQPVPQHEVAFDVQLVKGLRYDDVRLNARMPVDRIDSATLSIGAGGTVSLSAVVPTADGKLPEEMATAGYFAVQESWAPGEMIAGLHAYLIVNAEVEKRGTSWVVNTPAFRLQSVIRAKRD